MAKAARKGESIYMQIYELTDITELTTNIREKKEDRERDSES